MQKHIALGSVAGIGLVLSSFASSVRADDYTWTDNPALPTEPVNHVSFVRAFDNSIAFEDWRFSNKVFNVVSSTQKQWKSVDIVMQQCFGGGFANDMAKQAGTPYTLTTASNWNEIAWNLQEKANNPPALQNFTQSWLSAARAFPNAGFRQLASRARDADYIGPVRTDVTHTATEHTIYQSDDATPGGTNDGRPLDTRANERVFGVIAAFGTEGKLANRHKVNEQRVYDVMTQRFGAGRVAALYGNNAGQTFAGGTYYEPGPSSLPAMPVAGTNTRTDVYKAMEGQYFPNYTPGTNDRLVVYTTGHGGHGYFSRFGYQTLTSPGNEAPDGARFEIVQPTDAFLSQREAGGQPAETFNVNMFGDTDEATGLADIQIHLSRPLGFNVNVPTDARISINGMPVTGSMDLLPLNFADVRDLPLQYDGAADESTQFVYHLQVPNYAILGINPGGMTIDITNIPQYASDDRLIRGVSILSGDGEFVAVNVPEPTFVGAVLVAGVIGMRMRRRRV